MTSTRVNKTPVSGDREAERTCVNLTEAAASTRCVNSKTTGMHKTIMQHQKKDDTVSQKVLIDV